MNKTHTETFLALVEKGKMELYNRPHFEKFVSELDDGKYTMTIKKHKKIRSELQNAYYWGYIIKTFSEKVKSSPEETHKFLGEEILSYTYHCEHSGDMRVRIKSTTKLTTKEFELYMERCRVEFYDTYKITMLLPGETQFTY